MSEIPDDPIYAAIPLAVFAALAERLVVCRSVPPFAAIETLDGALRYGALLTGNRVRVFVTTGDAVTVGEVLRAPPVPVSQLARPQRTLIYDALSAWYARRLTDAGLLDTIDA